MLEIEKYIKKHVGRKVLLTLTFSPSPNLQWLPHQPPILRPSSSFPAVCSKNIIAAQLLE